ncbi:DUF2069 domain-containing protein [Thiohalophilus sp.]|uniref:DUF2069 domain-containing protein n=1 Tax=Thiohalophilus sp. TaxID=3028392 RepID=UPI002ACDD2EA|nr:DUF2069 domain-containing protein [Thiohalophilus sp.]MDZ7663518.1 DUF2069 domain-containing protein [Thiohalophilus sp.]
MNIIIFSRWLTLGAYFALLILLMLWLTVLAPPQSVPVSVALLLLVGPLLFPLRGLLHGRPYTHAWTSFLVLIYFVHGVVEAYSNPDERLYAALEILFSVLLYSGALLYARHRGRQLRIQSGGADTRAQKES